MPGAHLGVPTCPKLLYARIQHGAGNAGSLAAQIPYQRSDVNQERAGQCGVKSMASGPAFPFALCPLLAEGLLGTCWSELSLSSD